METVKETENYKLVQDRLYGVTRFIRKEDQFVSAMNTGSEAIEELENLLGKSDSAFDEYASKQEFY